MLDVSERGADGRRTPLLFVHGAFHGAWCWDAHFLDFFADRGHHALALNLRGHGDSPLEGPLNACSIADYVEDVRSVAATLPRPPVVIGHSMGGFLVQKYLAAQTAPAAVLIASAPPRGLARAMARVTRRNIRYSGRPAALRRPLVFFAEPAVARSTFYCRHTPDEIVAHTTAALCDESTRVLYHDLVYRDLARPAQVRVPMLVLGAELDGFFTPAEIRATARAYRAEAQMFPGMGHNMMLEPGWREVAHRIHTWLDGVRL